MSPSRLLLLLAMAPGALTLASCQAPQRSCAAAPAADVENLDDEAWDDEEEDFEADDLDDLERELDRARRRLDVARIEAESSVSEAEFGLDSARADLRDWVEFTAPDELEQARRELQALRDALQDAEDELAQLRMMYEGDDLAEATASLVLDRAARDVERRREEVAAYERALAHLEEVEHPRRARELEQAVHLAELAVMAARAQAELDLAAAEDEVAELEEELAELTAELEEED